MTIANETISVTVYGTGAQTVFNYNFLIPDATQCQLIYTDALGNQETLLPYTFTLSNVGVATGGTFTYPRNNGTPIAAGTSLTLRRVVPYKQLTNYTNQGGYYPQTVEQSLDNLEMQIQQLAEGISRALLFNVLDVGPFTTLPPAAERAGLALYFDANGNPIVSSGAGLAPISFTSQHPILPAGAFIEYWGFSPVIVEGGSFEQYSRTVTAAAPGSPDVWIEAVISANNGPAPVDFPGAYLASMPIGLYVQHIQEGTDPTNNLGTHSIMGYGVNYASGNNDCVAVSGRARKLNVPGGIGDCCGVWGSAYNESYQTGGVLGMETHIYQNVPGMNYSDRLNSHWSTGLHVYSDSTGSPALAGIAIDSSGQTPGRYGFWNAIIIDKNCFAGGLITGTIGINMASCDAFNNPQFGIKFGSAWQAQIYSELQPLTMQADNSIYLDGTSGTIVPGGCSVFVKLNGGPYSNFVIQSITGASLFEVLGSDGSVHIKSGTTVHADL